MHGAGLGPARSLSPPPPLTNPEKVLYGRIPGYRLSTLGEQMAVRAAEAAQTAGQRASNDPQPGLYRAGSGQTYRLGEIRGATMAAEQWQGDSAEPPQSRSQFYGRGSVTRVGGTAKWRGTLPDVKDYCCGNNLDVELEFGSSTSFRVARWRLWPLGGTRPADEAGWQNGDPSILNRVDGGSGAFEVDTNRYGSDFRDLVLPRAEPALCRDACMAEPRCLAWSYVKPGIQGAQARCWLKNPVPKPTRESCCVSGVR